MTVVKSFFKILNVEASPALSANPKKYTDISVVPGNFKTGSECRTVSNQ
jgi:hypothetical protein